ncbi:hypothetical protein [Saccharothrix coeruleofusca]|uniref:Uncharacterized protein n=1 Tax=Saccharothrix coeruleofusca TaxID=33919 RepID=A0A918EGJ9_9PSEU|nr:hypothetical protein [Saccharothrix coeruleofusca]MBP2338999.1 hypothetical protein [Saccharothrix coeruleofusca]GGP69418.1 hypothetical protein GCM10010185_47780 [Saccharothrix coeruleofusca]
MEFSWKADPSAIFSRPLVGAGGGRERCNNTKTCPDIWELDNGDVAVIGHDLTTRYAGNLPDGVNIGIGERLVVIPGAMFRAAKAGDT